MEEENKYWLITNTKNTLVDFKSLPLKLRIKILFGGKAWIMTKSQIAIKKVDDIEPIATDNGIEIAITANKPKAEVKE